MDTLRALLWKEGRAAASRVAACACLALLAGLAHIDWSYSFLPRFGSTSPLSPSPFTLHTVCAVVGILGALLMAMDLVAGERSRGTLPFQSNLPVRTAWLLGVKYAVGAAGLLVVLAAYWAGVYLGMPHWGNISFPWSQYGHSFSQYGHSFQDFVAMEVLTDVGYGRILLLWFLFYLILYSGAFLSSTFSNRPFQAAWTSLLMALVGLVIASRLSDPVSLFLRQALENGFHNGLILRPAFDQTLLLARAAAALLLAGCVLAWTCRGFRMQGSRGLPWIVSALFLICLAVTYEQRRSPPEKDWIEPVGRLPYAMGVVDLAVKGKTAIVLLTHGLSVVDVADRQAPREIGRVETDGWRLRRLAVSASAAYVWGWTEEQDSAGVAVFDLSQPERPRLQTQRLLHPMESDTTRWLRNTPRLTAWTVREGYLYAGLLGSEFLELRSFDVRRGGLPLPVQVLRIEETARHAWNYNWEMRLAGENAFLTLGHDFVVLDLTDPAAMQELSRTPLRRFGRSSRQYEELMEAFHLQLAQLPEEIASQVVGRHGLVSLENRTRGPMGSQRSYRISVPQALGAVSLVGDMAYVQRYLPRELAVLDISDPRRPVEVDYLPWRFSSQLVFSSQLIKYGEFVYSLSPSAIWVYDVDQLGTLLPGKRLQLRDHAGHGQRVTMRFPRADVLIPVDDHLCALLDNNLAIFKIPAE